MPGVAVDIGATGHSDASIAVPIPDVITLLNTWAAA